MADKKAETEKEKYLRMVTELREGNMMLDNEPVLFVRGYEQACKEMASAIRAQK